MLSRNGVEKARQVLEDLKGRAENTEADLKALDYVLGMLPTPEAPTEHVAPLIVDQDGPTCSCCHNLVWGEGVNVRGRLYCPGCSMEELGV